MTDDRQQGQRDRADEDFIRRAASWLRNDLRRTAGLASDKDAAALASLLDILATELPHLNPDVRRKTVDSCRQLLGELAEDHPAPSRLAQDARPDHLDADRGTTLRWEGDKQIEL